LVECAGILYGLAIDVWVTFYYLSIITYGQKYYLYGNAKSMYCIVEHFNQNSNITELCPEGSIHIGNLFDCPNQKASFAMGRALDFDQYIVDNSSTSYNHSTATGKHQLA
jgi:hypothetical protein